jgi:hypothetical protein
MALLKTESHGAIDRREMMYMPLSYTGTNCPYFVRKDGKDWGIFTFLYDQKGPAKLVSLHRRRADACERALALTKLIAHAQETGEREERKSPGDAQ